MFSVTKFYMSTGKNMGVPGGRGSGFQREQAQGCSIGTHALNSPRWGLVATQDPERLTKQAACLIL